MKFLPIGAKSLPFALSHMMLHLLMRGNGFAPTTAPAASAACDAAMSHASMLLAFEDPMPTLTIRNVPAPIVNSLKALARRHRRSMEQEVRELLEGHVAERRSVLAQIEGAWAKQTRRPSAREVDAWIAAGRS